jgi:hypothetical protein
VQLQSLNDRNRNAFHQRWAHPPGTPLTVPLIVYNTPQSVPAGEVIPSMGADAGLTVQVNARVSYSSDGGRAAGSRPP